MLGAQGAVAGTTAPIMFQGSAGAGAGASPEFERRKFLYGAQAEDYVVADLKRENTDLPYHREMGRRVIDEMLRGKYKDSVWVQDMKRLYEEDGGRVPSGFRSWQEVYDSYELLGTGADRDPLRGTSPKPPKGSRK